MIVRCFLINLEMQFQKEDSGMTNSRRISFRYEAINGDNSFFNF